MATDQGRRDAASIRLLIGGDVMLGRGVAQVIAARGADYPMSALASLRASADLFFVNLECAISDRDDRFPGPKAFIFRAPPEALDVLVSARVDLVSLANNHALDAGVASLPDTLAWLRRRGIAAVGAGADPGEASAMRSVECRGVHIGVLAACDHEEAFAAARGRPGIHFLDLQERQARRRLVALARAAASRCDHLVVSLHWMPNWVPSVPAVYRELAQELVEAGARIVWGHSPHHVLGSQWLGTGVALFSTGDLLDDYALDPDYRNDRQLLHLVELVPDKVQRLMAYPVELGLGFAAPAMPPATDWLRSRLQAACEGLGSDVWAGPRGGFEIRRSARKFR